MEAPNRLYLKDSDRITFLRLIGLLLIYIFPLILADVLYKDDIRRTIFLSPATWYRDGRPVMALLIEILSSGELIMDVSPLPLVLGILAIAYALTCFAKKYLSDYNSWQVVLCLLTFCISPLFLENLSFKFESLGMCISLALFLFLFSLPESTGNKTLIFAAFATTTTVLLTYQASIGAFLGLLFLTAMLESDTESLNKLFSSSYCKMAGFLSAILIYMQILAPVIVARDGYQGTVSQRIPFSPEGMNLLSHNFYSFINLFKAIFFPSSLSPIAWLSTIGLLAVLLYTFLKAYRHIKRKDYAKGLFTLLSPVLIFISSFFSLCFFKIPVVLPRALLSFNVFMLLTGIAILSLTVRRRFILLLFIPIYLFSYSLMYSYGNLLHTQRQYEQFIAKSVAYDLNRINNINSSFLFHIDGRILPAKELVLARKRYKIFDYLLVNIYNEYFWFGGDLISHYTNFVFNVKKMDKIDYRKFRMITGNSVYRIMQNQKTVVVDFKQKPQ